MSAFLGASLDGFIAEADGSLGFLKPFEQEEHGYAAFYASVDTLLMGRKTTRRCSASTRGPSRTSGWRC